MKKAFLTLLIAVVLCISIHGPTSATEYVNTDGVWWTGLTSDEQLVAVPALISSFELAYNFGFVRATLLDRLHYHSTRSLAQTSGDPESTFSFTKSFGVYQQEITDFYSAHPNATAVLVSSVLECLVDNPFFTCDQVAKFK